MDAIIRFLQDTGFYLFSQDGNWRCLIMLGIACVLLYLGIVKKFEPLLLVGIAFGFVNGVLIAKLKLPPFIATLGTQMMSMGFGSIITKVQSQTWPTATAEIGGWFKKVFIRAELFGIKGFPVGAFWLIGFFIIAALILHKTKFGRYVYAIGSNERTARLSGIHVERVKTWIYILMGALVAVTAVIQVARIGSMDYANAGSGYEMDAIAAVVVGGTSMSGGKGSIGGTVLGMLIIAVMNNLLNLMGVPPFLREAFKGAIVIVAVLLQRKEK